MVNFKIAFHNEAKPGDIAPIVLLPGDPLRAKFIARKYLRGYKRVNNIRGMLAYTGWFKGVHVTVMGSGMGVPSAGIYINELYHIYGVKVIIRIGSCGAYSEDLELKDIILAESSYYEGAYALQFKCEECHWANPSSNLNSHIEAVASSLGIELVKGPVAAVDSFDPYNDDPLSIMKRYKANPETAKIIGADMESFVLFYLAKYYGRESACLLTVADSPFGKGSLTKKQRQANLISMIEVALEAAVSYNI